MKEQRAGRTDQRMKEKERIPEVSNEKEEEEDKDDQYNSQTKSPILMFSKHFNTATLERILLLLLYICFFRYL